MHNLPVILTDLAGQRFDCQGCTNCCRELVVHLTAEDVARLDAKDWQGQLNAAPYVTLHGAAVLNHRAGGGCVFLEADGRCRIHREHGAAAKPLACRLYPFTLERQCDELHASLRFDCPTVRSSRGRAVAGHRSEVAELAGRLFELGVLDPAAGRRAVSWDRRTIATKREIDSVISCIDGMIGDPSVDVGARLRGISALIETLSAARVDRVRDERLDELLGLLTADVLESATPGEADSPPGLSPREMSLFRQVVFGHCEYASFSEARMGMLGRMRHRWGQLRRGRHFAAGRGAVTSTSIAGPTVSFERVEGIGPPDEPDSRQIAELLARSLRTRLLGRTVFGPGFFGWSILDGLRALMLGVCVSGWLARWCAAGDDRGRITTDDVSRAVGIVDRTATRAPLIATRTHRLRVDYLCRNRGLIRLLDRYRVWP